MEGLVFENMFENKDKKRKKSEDQVSFNAPQDQSWKTAESDILSKRRMISVTSPYSSNGNRSEHNDSNNDADNESKDRRLEHYKVEMKSLNRGFEACIKKKLDFDPKICLRNDVEKYKVYASIFGKRYTRETGNTVATCGMGDCGQLGLTDNIMGAKSPKPIKDGFGGEAICQVACGGLHNVVLTDQGNVFTFGCNDDGAVGIRSKDSTIYDPQLLSQGDEGFLSSIGSKNEGIMQVAAGDSSSFALTAEGDLYFWGAYKDTEGKHFRYPTPNFDKRTWEDKDIFDKETKEVVPPPRGFQVIPIQVELPKEAGRAVQVECGDNFSVILFDNDQLYSTGLDARGEMARGDHLPPVRDENSKKYNLEVLKNEYLKPKPVIFAPVPNVLKRRVISVACGANHLLVATVDICNGGYTSFTAYSSGLNNYGQLGHGDLDDRKILTCIEALKDSKITSVAAGNHHSLCLDASGTYLYAFGRGDSGQLGLESTIPPPGYLKKSPLSLFLEPPSQKNPKIVQIVAGSNHNLVRTENGDIYSWGYGDLGALGLGTEEDEYRPKKMKISSRSKVCDIDAGGQHTAFVIEKAQK